MRSLDLDPAFKAIRAAAAELPIEARRMLEGLMGSGIEPRSRALALSAALDGVRGCRPEIERQRIDIARAMLSQALRAALGPAEARA